MDKDKPQKPSKDGASDGLMKLISIFALVFAAIDVYSSILIFIGDGGSYSSRDATGPVGIALVGILGLILAVVAIVAGVMGLRCSKDSSSAGALFVVSVISLVLAVIYFGGGFMLRAEGMTPKGNAAQVAVFFVLAVKALSAKRSNQ